MSVHALRKHGHQIKDYVIKYPNDLHVKHSLLIIILGPVQILGCLQEHSNDETIYESYSSQQMNDQNSDAPDTSKI